MDIPRSARSGDDAGEVERDHRAAQRKQRGPQRGLDLVKRSSGRAARDRERLVECMLDIALTRVDSGRHGALSWPVFMVWRPDICREAAPYLKSDRVSDRNFSRYAATKRELHPTWTEGKCSE